MAGGAIANESSGVAPPDDSAWHGPARNHGSLPFAFGSLCAHLAAFNFRKRTRLNAEGFRAGPCQAESRFVDNALHSRPGENHNTQTDKERAPYPSKPASFGFMNRL